MRKKCMAEKLKTTHTSIWAKRWRLESLIDLSERYKIYSERIVNKYHKSKEISEEILALAKETEPNLGGFTLCILRTDSDGKSEVDSFCL